MTHDPHRPSIVLRPCRPDDADYVVGLKERTMRADLERLGRWHPQRSRDRVRLLTRFRSAPAVKPLPSCGIDDDSGHARTAQRRTER